MKLNAKRSSVLPALAAILTSTITLGAMQALAVGPLQTGQATCYPYAFTFKFLTLHHVLLVKEEMVQGAPPSSLPLEGA